MAWVLGHRQTKGAATDIPYLPSPRHTSTLPELSAEHQRNISQSARLQVHISDSSANYQMRSQRRPISRASVFAGLVSCTESFAAGQLAPTSTCSRRSPDDG